MSEKLKFLLDFGRICSLISISGLFNFSCTETENLFNKGTASLVIDLPTEIKSFSANSCMPCHQSDYNDWKNSMHGKAFSNEIFQQSFEHEPQEWCVNCHAPLKQQAFPAIINGFVDRTKLGSTQTQELRNEGINCIACHVREAQILTSKPVSGRAPHVAVFEPELGSAEFCAGCHQFNFPYPGFRRGIHYGDEPMQNTYKEWQNSSASSSGIKCQNCHFSSDHHKLVGPHSQDWLKKKVVVFARMRKDLIGEWVIDVHLQIKGIGHSFPTGDLFRTISFVVFHKDRVVGSTSFGRVVSDQKDNTSPVGFYKRVVKDTSLKPNEQNYIDHRFTIDVDPKLQLGKKPQFEYRLYYLFQNTDVEHVWKALESSKLSYILSEGKVAEPRYSKERLGFVNYMHNK